MAQPTPALLRPATLLPLLLAWGPFSCGPGPLPAETPPTALTTPLEPMPVQVESTVQAVAGADADEPHTRPSVSEQTVTSSAGFKTPESVLYDAASDLYLVANINGTPTALDDNGFISRVNPDGSIRDLTFIAGMDATVTLNAPKRHGHRVRRALRDRRQRRTPVRCKNRQTAWSRRVAQCNLCQRHHVWPR